MHYRITVNAMLKMGCSSADAQRIAHGASVYADHATSKVLSMDKWFHAGIVENHYRDDIDYSATAGSQDESNSHWHSMMSNAEKKGGMKHSDAMQRGLKFGWSNIMTPTADLQSVPSKMIRDIIVKY